MNVGAGLTGKGISLLNTTALLILGKQRKEGAVIALRDFAQKCQIKIVPVGQRMTPAGVATPAGSRTKDTVTGEGISLPKKSKRGNMRWITNILDPKKYKDSPQAIRNLNEWLSDKIIGEPQATTTYTVEELKKFDMVGVYVEDSEEE